MFAGCTKVFFPATPCTVTVTSTDLSEPSIDPCVSKVSLAPTLLLVVAGSQSIEAQDTDSLQTTVSLLIPCFIFTISPVYFDPEEYVNVASATRAAAL